MSAKERSLYNLRKGRLASDQFWYLLSLLKSVFLLGSWLLANYGLMAAYWLSIPFPFCQLGHLGLLEGWMDPCPFIFYLCAYVCPCGGREQLVGINSLLPPRGFQRWTPSSVLVASTFNC